MNSEGLYNFVFIADESSSDENAHDVGDEKTTCQESSSNKDIGHDVNSYQLQNRSTFYSTGEKHLTAFYDVLMLVCKHQGKRIAVSFLSIIYQISFQQKGKKIVSNPR